MKIREPFNSFSHFFGIGLAILGLVLLLMRNGNNAWEYVSFAIYGTILILLYFFSTMLHSLPEGKKRIWLRFDHMAIYWLIAGSYTPFCLTVMRGGWGWSILGVIWTMAILFTVLKAIFIDMPDKLSTLIYVLMGWLVVIGFYPILKNLPFWGIVWLVLGGLTYTIGGVIYVCKKPNLCRLIDHHGVWHLLVLLGSFFHYLTIYYFL